MGGIKINIIKSLLNDEVKIKEISTIVGILATIGYILIQGIITAITMLLIIFINPEVSFDTVLAITGLAMIIASIFIGILAGKIFIDKNNIEEYKKKSTDKKQYLHVFLLMIGVILIRNILLNDIMYKFEGPISEAELELIFNNASIFSIVIIGIVLAIQVLVIAPIFEELFFRSIIFKGFLFRYKDKPSKALIWSSIIFGVVHLNIPQGINAFILGLILGGIYYYTGNIKLAIFAHFINNLLVFIPSPSTLFLKILFLVSGVFIINKGIYGIKKQKMINYIDLNG